MDYPTALGAAAGTLTTLAFVPQVLKAWRTRRTRDISLPWLLLFCLGVTLWLLYGSATGSTPIIVTNAVTLALGGGLLALKLRHG